MKYFEFECINKPINNDVIKNALNNNFHIILGGRSNGRKAFLESLGYKVISYKEYLEMKDKMKNESIRED